jgi:hypothetical protein
MSNGETELKPEHPTSDDDLSYLKISYHIALSNAEHAATLRLRRNSRKNRITHARALIDLIESKCALARATEARAA